MVLMSDLEFQLFPWYQQFCHAILTYVAFDELTFLLFISMLLSNLRRFEKYRQYIGGDCTRSGALFLEGCDLQWLYSETKCIHEDL